jgi:hypothetical protein
MQMVHEVRKETSISLAFHLCLSVFICGPHLEFVFTVFLFKVFLFTVFLGIPPYLRGKFEIDLQKDLR